MKALLLTAPAQLSYTELPDPTPQPEEVVVRVAACGICGSDLHGWDGSSGRRRPPLVMGHEAAGVIVAVGAAVSGWKVGERVTFDSTVYCGECPACRAGQVNLCRERRVLGVAPAHYRQDGAFAEYVALPARGLYRVPDTLTFEQAALAEPVSIALHAVARAETRPGDAVVVVGSGMIGLLVIQAARVAGAEHVVAVDLNEDRLALARRLGATETVRAGTMDTLQQVRDAAPPAGHAAAFEVVGFGPTTGLAIESVRDGGTVVLVGNLQSRVEFPLQTVVTRELRVLGSCGSAGEYPLALELIASGRVDVGPLISAVAPLAEGPAWFERLTSAEGRGLLKVLLKP